MKETWKLCIAVALLAFFSADFGLRTVVILVCSPQIPAGQYDKGSSISENQSASVFHGVTSAVQDHSQPYAWCNQAIYEQKKLSQWVMVAISDIKITDLLVAVFTLFLVIVGYRQASISSAQTKIAERQADIARRALIAQRPLVGYLIHKTHIKLSKSNPTEIEEFSLSLVFKNFGGSPATKISYWMGEPLYLPYAGDTFRAMPGVQEGFSNAIFKTDGKPGYSQLYPGGDFDTDRISIALDNLMALYKREKHLLIWSVIRWGSDIEDDNWFSETALQFEFVLDIDPNNISRIDNNPAFRVATIGYRHREGHDQRTN